MTRHASPNYRYFSLDGDQVRAQAFEWLTENYRNPQLYGKLLPLGDECPKLIPGTRLFSTYRTRQVKTVRIVANRLTCRRYFSALRLEECEP